MSICNTVPKRLAFYLWLRLKSAFWINKTVTQSILLTLFNSTLPWGHILKNNQFYQSSLLSFLMQTDYTRETVRSYLEHSGQASYSFLLAPCFNTPQPWTQELLYSWAEDSVPWSCESRDEFERLTQNRKPSRRKDHLRTAEKEMSEGRHSLS